ncbi:MAG: MFS transporter [Oscillospiraceae bacterium]|nr:MFS transporter [Oscillospiraceae bacterium]
MKSFFFGIKRHIVDMLNLDRMGDKYKVLAVNYIFLIFYTTLEGTFVNTLLYRITPEMSIVIYYRATTYIAAAIMIHFAAYIGQKKNPVVVIRMGACAFLLMYLSLFFGMNHMAVIYPLTAFLSGTGGAFYWTAHNIFVTHYTTKDNRDIGISILGIIQGVITIFCPVISGFVIKLMPGDIGYRIMFGLGMLSVVAQLFVHAKLHPIQQKKHKSEIRLAVKLLYKKLSCKLMLAYEFVRGMRDGTFMFILNMLLFEIVTDESLIGINTFLTGVMSITGSWAYGRLVRPGNRVKYATAATTVLIGICAGMLLKMNVLTVMAFTVLNAFIQLFIINSINNTTYDILGQSESTRRSMGEMLAFREAALAIGRILGLAFTMSFNAARGGYIVAMLVLTATQYIVAVLMKIAIWSMGRRKKRAAPVPAD